jgi:hypothetical protein
MSKYTLTGILGWFFDAYIIECLVAPWKSLLGWNTEPLGFFSMIVLVGLFGTSIWYHVKGKFSTTWISPGEYLVGTRKSDQGKIRINPWPVSRLALFVVIIYNLLQTARTYDAGEVFFFGYGTLDMVILGSFLFNALVLAGSALLANARLAGLALLSLGYMIFVASLDVNYMEIKQLLQLKSAQYALAGLILNLAVGAYYFGQKAKRKGVSNKVMDGPAKEHLMSKSTLSGIMAWIFDTKIIGCLTAPILHLLRTWANPLNLIGFLAILGLFIGGLWYHLIGKNKSRWISPGEYMIGTLSTSEGKIRINPWPITRLALFLLIGYNLTQAARGYEPGVFAFYGQISLVSLILGSLIQNVLLLWGSALLAMARPLGLLALTMAYLFLLGSTYVNGRELAELAQSNTSTSAVWGLVANLAIGGYYFYRKTQTKGSPEKKYA